MEKNLNGLNMTAYLPFANIKNFTLYAAEQGDARFVVYDDKSRTYTLEIKPNGFVPKTGLLLAQSIENEVQDKSVLDLCTGETGAIAIHAAVFGAKNVLGTDVDENTANWAKRNAIANHLSNAIFLPSDLFDNVGSKFNIITANPPQMPMINGHFHDSGGNSGREIIEKIIIDSPHFLHPGGAVHMLLFDFLGIEESFGKYPPIKQIFEENGFTMKVVSRTKRTVRKGGATEKSFRQIAAHYPLFSFKQNGGTNYHEILIVKATLNNSEK